VATVGLVGGLGPESTIDYYRRILDAWAREDPTTAPSLVIDSLDVGRALHLVDTDQSALVAYLLASLHRLAGAGVAFAALTANTPHLYGVAVVPPAAVDRAWVHACYVDELLRGEFREATRQRFVALVAQLRADADVDGVVLGGTELPLLLPAPVLAGLPVLDTTALHVAAIVARLRRTGDRPTDAPTPAI
jgi:aspartate racemase